MPTGMEAGTPFGPSVQALATYLRYSHAISYERLSALFGEVFDLSLSEGALSNMFQSIHRRLEGQVTEILERLRRSRLVCSDETSARAQRADPVGMGVSKPGCLRPCDPARAEVGG